MEIFSYIMTVATSQPGMQVFLAIKNIAGTGHAPCGRSGEFGNIELWIIPKSKKSKEELVTQLQAVPFVQQASVVKLSKPVTSNELLEVRELFTGLGWNTSDVKDEELSLFLNARLLGKHTHMIDVQHGKRGKSENVRFIRVEEHPNFSPEWITNEGVEEEIPDRELTIDDFVIQTVFMKETKEEPPQPPTTTRDKT